eukprot:1850939-Amphidinium_carterae.1
MEDSEALPMAGLGDGLHLVVAFREELTWEPVETHMPLEQRNRFTLVHPIHTASTLEKRTTAAPPKKNSGNRLKAI